MTTLEDQKYSLSGWGLGPIKSDTKYDFATRFSTAQAKYSLLNIEYELGSKEIIFTENTVYKDTNSGQTHNTKSRWILKGSFIYNENKEFQSGTVTSWATKQHFSVANYRNINFFYGKDLSSAPLSINVSDLALGAGSRLDFSDFQGVGFDSTRNPSTIKFEDFSKYLPSSWVANPFGQNLISSSNTSENQSPLTGTANKADVFVLTGTPEFGAETADRITNFNPKEKDKLQIDVSNFGGDAAGTFKIAKNAKALTKALASTTDFIYLKSTGELYYNENGTLPGFGDGGIFAIIENKANITTKNVEFL